MPRSGIGFAAVKQQIIPGATVGHVGEAVAAGIVGTGITAGVRNLDHFQTAGGRIYQNHSYLFASGKRKVLPKKHGTHAGGTANGNRMETIRDPVIVRDGAEAGIDGIRSTINGDVDGKAVGGGI